MSSHAESDLANQAFDPIYRARRDCRRLRSRPERHATYTQVGARFGFNLLWIALFLFPLLAAVQELCARVGVVTGKGIVAVIRDDYVLGESWRDLLRATLVPNVRFQFDFLFIISSSSIPSRPWFSLQYSTES